MTGYCPDCGNTMCICSLIAADKRRSFKSEPFPWADVLWRRAMILASTVALCSVGWWPVVVLVVLLDSAQAFVSERLIYWQRELIAAYKQEEASRRG